MPVNLEILGPTGALQLGLDSRPIGSSFGVTELLQSGWDNHPYPKQDPETNTRLAPWPRAKLPFFPTTDKNLTLFQLNDGKFIVYDVGYRGIVGYAPISQPGVSFGKLLQVGIEKFYPTPKAGDHLQVYDPSGNLLWSADSLKNSLQFIYKASFNVQYRYSDAPIMYYDISPALPIGQVFFTPVLPKCRLGGYFPQIWNPTKNAWESINNIMVNMKRVGRRIYFTIEDTTMETNYDSVTQNEFLSDVLGGTHLEVVFFYVPTTTYTTVPPITA